MKLNHLNLGVTDVPATVALLETYFGLRRMAGPPFTAKMAFLIDDDGSLLSLMNFGDTMYPKTFHIGFMQETAEEVSAIREKLVAGGFDPQEAREEHGRFTFYFNAPGGFMIEVSSMFQKPTAVAAK